jgi:hypothetical protein
MRKTTAAPEVPSGRQTPQRRYEHGIGLETNGLLPLAAEVSERLLDKLQVRHITHLGTVKLNALERADADLLRRLGLASPFPRRRWIGRRCYWLASEVMAWMRALPAGYGEPIVDPEVTRAAQKRRHEKAARQRLQDNAASPQPRPRRFRGR